MKKYAYPKLKVHIKHHLIESMTIKIVGLDWIFHHILYIKNSIKRRILLNMESTTDFIIC